MALVSIVLPTRDRADMLEKAVEGVLSQTHESWELVIVDDASTDETPRVIAELVAGDPRIRSLRNGEHRGFAEALNRGFSETRGDLLTWTSDDDLYKPEALEVLAKTIAGFDVVYSDMAHVDEVGRVIAHRRARRPEDLLLENIIGRCFLYRRSLLDRVGQYDPHWEPVADYDFWIRAARAGMSFHSVPDEVF